MVTVSVPPGIQSGDLLIAQIVVFDGTGANVPVAPSGWTVIRHDSATSYNKITSWLYFKRAGASGPASYSWGITPQFAAGAMGAWRGASSSPIEQSSGASANSGKPVIASAPSLTPMQNGDQQIYFYGSQDSKAPIIGQLNPINFHSVLSSTQEGFTLAFGDLAAPAQGVASPTYIVSATSQTNGTPVLTAQAVLVRSGP
jgi:hypothetical protein